MSTEKKTSSPLAQIAAGILILAAITGYYLYEAGARKAGAAETATGEVAAAPEAPMAVSKDLATGALSAFLVHEKSKPLADLQFQDETGKPLRLSDWKGRVVLINLWATWCAPCRKEMPELAKLQKELGSVEFEVVAISVDRKGAEASAAFLKEAGADNLNLYIDPTTRVVNDVRSSGLPATILVSREGRELGRILGPADWASPEAQALIKAALAQN